ncbi:EAL domain-containing protein [Mesorhizobium sp. 10J20-29]
MPKRAIALVMVGLLVLWAQGAGWLKPLDDRLGDWRMASLEREPTGGIVLVDIDAKSISGLGRWPWPRRIHADLIDRLSAAGASEIAFDVDFSAPSTPSEDKVLQAALERAGGSVILVAFDQRASATAGGSSLHNNRPIARFADNAWLAGVNVLPDVDGRIRSLDYALQDPTGALPSLAAMLAGGAADRTKSFRVDFGIRADRIDRISVLDLLSGRVEDSRIAGKKIIVGAEAIELRDIFHVPVHGFVSGSMVHALGAESILQGRALTRTGSVSSILGLLLTLLAGVHFSRRLGWKGLLALLAGSALAIELAAVAVQRLAPLEIATGSWLLALAGMMLVTLVSEIDFRRIIIAIYRNREANVQTILNRVIADNFAGVLVVDGEGAIVAASEAANAILAAEEGLTGRRLADVLPTELHAAFIEAAAAGQEKRSEPFEVEVTMPSGQRTFELVVTHSWLSGGLDEEGHERPDALVTCLTFVDTTERKQAADRIAYLARFDPMTGLANRNQFLERAAAGLAGAGYGDPQTVLCVDLDRFKSVNDTLGHSFGDQLLCAVANRLVSMAPEGSVVARLGGTDFAILLGGADSAGHAVQLAQELASPSAQSYRIGDRRAVVTLSIGIATATQGEADDAPALLKQADTALHRAKEAGGNCHVVYDASMVAGLEGRRQLEIDLWDAFEKGEFEVYFQPQLSLDDGRVIGAEALMRWSHPDRGFVSPAEFVPVLESIGLMEATGRLVLEEACRAAMEWPDDIQVAVNVSSVQFTRDDLAGAVADVLQRTGLPGERLELEITESLFLNENQALIATMDRIRAMGVHFSLDDFGTGYSALAYVQKFPIDKIKIDRSFIKGIPHDQGSVAIVRAVAAMAESLDMRLIAEGIDREEHISILRLLGCHEGQGFLFSRPLPRAKFRDFLEKRSQQRAADVA